MKTLACKDMGVECDYVAEAETEEEVMGMSMEHAKKVHKEKMDEMMENMTMDEMKEEMRSKIKEEK